MFKTRLQVKDAADPGEWVVCAPLVWDDGVDTVTVHQGFITDLASVPQALRAIFDIVGPSRKPGVMHDWLYCTQRRTRAESDELFRKALAAEGLGAVKRNAYWLGVRMGGWAAWRKSRGGIKRRDFETCRDYVLAKADA